MSAPQEATFAHEPRPETPGFWRWHGIGEIDRAAATRGALLDCRGGGGGRQTRPPWTGTSAAAEESSRNGR